MNKYSSLLVLTLILSLTTNVSGQGNASPSNLQIADAQITADLIKLAQNQTELEENISEVQLSSWNFRTNSKKIQQLEQEYQRQLEIVNCYRDLKVGVVGCENYKIPGLETRGDLSPFEKFVLIKNIRSGNTGTSLEVVLSNSQRIGERLSSLRQRNLGIRAIVISFFAVLISLVAVLVEVNFFNNLNTRISNLVGKIEGCIDKHIEKKD